MYANAACQHGIGSYLWLALEKKTKPGGGVLWQPSTSDGAALNQLDNKVLVNFGLGIKRGGKFLPRLCPNVML